MNLLMLSMIALLWLPISPLYTQQPDAAPSVLVVISSRESGNSLLDKVRVTVRRTLENSFQIQADYEIRTLREDLVPESVRAGSRDALAQFAEMQMVDYLVFGSVSTDAGERIVIDAGVWDRSANSISVSEQLTAGSLFETFHATDELAVRLLASFNVGESAVQTVRLTTDEQSGRHSETSGFALPVPPTQPPSGGGETGTRGTFGDGRPRSVVMRLQSGGGFLGAAGADFYPGGGLLRTGIVAGGTLQAEEPTPAIAAAVAIEPQFGRLVTPVGVSSFITADPNAVTAAVGLSLGLSVQFDRVVRELFFDNVIYFNAYPDAGLPLVYLPVIGVRL